jgi:hypothetical protein
VKEGKTPKEKRGEIETGGCVITLDQKSVLSTQIYSLPSRGRPNILQRSDRRRVYRFLRRKAANSGNLDHCDSGDDEGLAIAVTT